ncbi:MAG: PKD domain-containing protein [Fibrobacterota bacterium]
MKTGKLKQAAIILSAFAGLYLATCTNDDALFNPAKKGESAKCAAFLAAATPSAPVADTTGLAIIDTFHTGDTLAFIGVVCPADAKVTGAWTFGDSINDSGAIVLHAYTASGHYTAVFTIRDAAGYSLSDTVTVVVNTPPRIPVLKSPAPGTQKEVNSTPAFTWGCSDADNEVLGFDLYVGPSRIFTTLDRQARNITDSSYVGWGTGNVSKPFYWQVVAFDKLDTVKSVIDSFNVGHYTMGHITGHARLQGIRRHNGIRVTLTGVNTYTIPTDDSGAIAVDVEPGTYSITATDTLRNAFATAVGNDSVRAGQSADFGVLTLLDNHVPHIAFAAPATGALLTALSPRNLTVSGTFIDTGSQVHCDSVRATVNSTPVTGITRTSSVWQFTMSNIADGHYTVRVDAADSAGNAAAPATRSFTVNSKTLDVRIGILHDTLYCTASVANARPDIRAYYWNYDKHATPAWNDSTLTNQTTATRAWAFAHPPVAGADTVIVMAVDDSGMAVYDTVRYGVSLDLPVADAGNDTIVAIGDSAFLHGRYAQQYGHAVKFEWAIGSTAYFARTTNADTAFRMYSFHPGVPCYFRVTDDRGNMTTDSLTVVFGRAWEPVGGTNLATAHKSEAFSLGVFSSTEMYLAFPDATNFSRLRIMKWNGTAWSTTGSNLTAIVAKNTTVAVGTGFGYGGITYSIPYVAVWDDSVKVFTPNGTLVSPQPGLGSGPFRFVAGPTMYRAACTWPWATTTPRFTRVGSASKNSNTASGTRWAAICRRIPARAPTISPLTEAPCTCSPTKARDTTRSRNGPPRPAGRT